MSAARAEVERLQTLVKRQSIQICTAYKEGMEDGRDGWYNEQLPTALSDEELWNESVAKINSEAAEAAKGE